MSTYADVGHVYGLLEASGDTCENVVSGVAKLRGIFAQANWDIEDVGAVIKIKTDSFAFVISFCASGPGSASIYSFDFDGASAPAFQPVVIDDVTNCCTGGCPQALLDAGFSPTIAIPASPTRSEVHAAAIQGLTIMYASLGIIATVIKTETDGLGDVISQIELVGGNTCSARITFGNALGTSTIGEAPRGGGFIARSQDSLESGNKIELYVTSEKVKVASIDRRIFIYSRLGGWPVGGTGSDHPSFIAEDEEGTSVEVAVLNGTEDIRCFVNEFQALLDQPDLNASTQEGKLFAGALKLKTLEGESESARNITKATIFAGSPFGTKLRDVSNLVGNFAIELEGNFTNVNIVGPVGDGGDGGPLIMNNISESMPFNVGYPNGISWLGGAAQIWEPWVACNPNDLKSPAPCIGQMWDAIMPYRNINLEIVDTAHSDGVSSKCLSFWPRF